MCSVSDLPSEVLDAMFGYLPFAEQKRARLVCRRWHNQLASPRYWKAAKLLVNIRDLLDKRKAEDLLRISGQHKCTCVEVRGERVPMNQYNRHVNHSMLTAPSLKQLLSTIRSSVEELYLQDCYEITLKTVFNALGTMHRLRHLKVDCSFDGNLAGMSREASWSKAGAGFASITHLNLFLENESCVKLVSRLASQLTCLEIGLPHKDVLLRCLNKSHFAALRSLTLKATGYGSRGSVSIRPGELSDGSWRMLEQLETLRCTKANLLQLVLPQLLPRCQNLKRLTIGCCGDSIRCVDQVSTIKGLKELSLGAFLTNDKGLLTLSNLLELEHLRLMPTHNVRLQNLPKLSSVFIESELYQNANGLLSELVKLDGIKQRRLRKIHFKSVELDVQSYILLGSLSIDVLSFEDCRIDGAVLDIIANPKARRCVLRFVMQKCTIRFSDDVNYKVRTVAELRTKCPHLQIAEHGTMSPQPLRTAYYHDDYYDQWYYSDDEFVPFCY